MAYADGRSSDVRSGKTILTHGDLPRFLWAGCVRHPGPETMFVGFLRGEFLIAVSTLEILFIITVEMM